MPKSVETIEAMLAEAYIFCEGKSAEFMVQYMQDVIQPHITEREDAHAIVMGYLTK